MKAIKHIINLTGAIIFLLASCPSISSAEEALPIVIDRLVSYWPATGNANDALGPNHGSLIGGASIVTDSEQQAFQLNVPTVTGAFVNIPDHPSLNFGFADFSASVWVNFSVLSGVGEQVLIEKWVQTFPNNNCQGWSLSKLGDVNNTLALSLSGGGSLGEAVALFVQPPPMQVGTWYHAVFTRSGNVFSVYWDGVLLGSVTAPKILDWTY